MPNDPRLRDYCNIGWSQDLKPYGLGVSVWLRPEALDREGDPSTWVAYKYRDLETGEFMVATTDEECEVIHRGYGAPWPWVKPSKRNQQLSIFVREVI